MTPGLLLEDKKNSKKVADSNRKLPTTQKIIRNTQFFVLFSQIFINVPASLPATPPATQSAIINASRKKHFIFQRIYVCSTEALSKFR